jgi:hypothetical protein
MVSFFKSLTTSILINLGCPSLLIDKPTTTLALLVPLPLLPPTSWEPKYASSSSTMPSRRYIESLSVIAYDIAKNKLKIENFSGRKQITIEQEFYAHILLLNMIEDLNPRPHDTDVPMTLKSYNKK